MYRLIFIIIFFHINTGLAQISEFREFVKEHISKDVVFAYARSNSTSAYGWGYGITLKVASQRALKECNSRDRYYDCSLQSVRNIIDEYSYLKNKSNYITKKDKSKNQVNAKGLKEYKKFILDNKKRFKWFAYAENTSGKQWGFGASTYSQNSADKRAIKNCNNGYSCRVIKMQNTDEQFNLPLLNDIMEIYVTNTNANIRRAPNTNSPIVKTILKEKNVLVSGKVEGTEWYQIIQDSKIIGYSHKSLFIKRDDHDLILEEKNKKEKLHKRQKERELEEQKKKNEALYEQEELIFSLNSEIQNKETEIKLLEKKLTKFENLYNNTLKKSDLYIKEISEYNLELVNLKNELNEKNGFLNNLKLCFILSFICIN